MNQEPHSETPLRSLIVEDDFISRCVLQEIMAEYGPCDVASNGPEALAAYRLRLEQASPYTLVYLDIMMPEMSGHEVLQKLRRLETEYGKDGHNGAKVIMTTALNDKEHILAAFRAQCDAYLIKPVSLEQTLGALKQLKLLG